MNDTIKDRVPSIHDLMYPTLQALGGLGGSGQVAEIDNRIAEMLELDDEVLSFRRGKKQKVLFNWRCAWARTHLKFGDAVENTARGVWAITSIGRELKPEKMRPILNESHRAARDRRRTEATSEDSEDLSEEENEVSWEGELLDVLQSISPDAFERLAQLILRESNFSKVEVTGRSGDGGIDGTGVLNVELISFQVFFQCKRYRGSVGSSAIRDFRGAMIGRADKGILLTTGHFTPAAREEATRDGAPPIDLIDGEQLCLLLKRLGLGVDSKQVEVVSIKQGFFESI